MNLIWNKNIALFCNRFPALAAHFSITPQTAAPDQNSLPWKIGSSKKGLPTAEENGRLIHSRYDPVHEAEQTVTAAHHADTETGIFLGCGLGYGADAYARLFPQDTLIIIEADPVRFFSALSITDWEYVFKQKRCIILLQAPAHDCINLITAAGSTIHCAVFFSSVQTSYAADYFNSIHTLIERNRKKESVNALTLERFGKLWVRNSCRNIRFLEEKEGVIRYRNTCPPSLPVILLAAGPTLSAMLPYLAALKKRALLICVDTALRSCLRAGVEPDFILLVDPQYYAARHILDLSAPSSILITESAAYPPVYRFRCKEIILCSSLFPLGKYIESKIGSKGALAAGGSVSTTAWDFARFIGAKEIYCSGLDLSYPACHTHIKGSTFEETIHTASNRTHPAESAGTAALFGANMKTGTDYEGKPVLTDDRMTLFAWWFESHIAEYTSIHVYTLSPESLAIPGIHVAAITNLLSRPTMEAERNIFFTAADTQRIKTDPAVFHTACNELITGLNKLYDTARQGEQIASNALNNKEPNYRTALSQLTFIDQNIKESSFKNIAALVFPSEKKLESLYHSSLMPEDPAAALLTRSLILYRELETAILRYKKDLFLE